MKYLKIYSLEAGDYYENDEIMLHAMFQVLVDFMEKEKPGEIVEWGSDKNHQHAWNEMQSLYKWWREERPNRKDPTDNIEPPPLKECFVATENKYLNEWIRHPDPQYKPYYNAIEELGKLEEQWLQEDQKNLHRLIDIRPYMWI